MLKIIIIFLISFSIQADTYLDISAEILDESRDSFYQRDGVPIKNIIGSIEFGYEIDKYTVFIKHSSSVQQEDAGLNTVGIKVRLF